MAQPRINELLHGRILRVSLDALANTADLLRPSASQLCAAAAIAHALAFAPFRIYGS